MKAHYPEFCKKNTRDASGVDDGKATIQLSEEETARQIRIARLVFMFS